MPTPRLTLAATTTAVAGLVHLAAGPAHSQYPLWYAGGFVAVGVMQLTAAAGLLARRPAAVTGTVAVHLAALVTWSVSRTVGLPSVGAHSLGAADAIVAVLQVTALVAIIVARLAARSPSGGGRPRAPRLVATMPSGSSTRRPKMGTMPRTTTKSPTSARTAATATRTTTTTSTNDRRRCRTTGKPARAPSQVI